MLVGSSVTAVMWGTSEPEGGTQRRVRSRGSIRERGGRNLQDEEQKDAWLADPEGPGLQGHTGRGVAGFVGGGKKLGLFPTGKKIQGGVYVGEGSNQDPFPMESWGSQLGNNAGGLNKPLSTALGSPLPGAAGCPRTSSVLPAHFPKLQTYTRGSTT